MSKTTSKNIATLYKMAVVLNGQGGEYVATILEKQVYRLSNWYWQEVDGVEKIRITSIDDPVAGVPGLAANIDSVSAYTWTFDKHKGMVVLMDCLNSLLRRRAMWINNMAQQLEELTKTKVDSFISTTEED